MKTTMLVCVITVLAMLASPSSPVGAPDPSRVVTLPFGTLLRGAACPAATHTIVSPCFPYEPGFFVVFNRNNDLTEFEGKNVKMRGMVDLTSCGLPLIRASKIAVSDVLPPCPAPCPPNDPFCLQP